MQPSTLAPTGALDALDIVALGEPMIEFNQTGERDGRLYLRGFGGDSSNFAVAAARQGARVGYLSAVGDDENGRLLRALWAAEGVDDRGVKTDPDANTAIYFVTHDADGHHFQFFRKGSAASRITPADLPRTAIARARCLHLSGISLAISHAARDTCMAAIAIAHEAGVPVCFDTNLRLRLWPIDEARPVMDAAMRACEICLPSLEDIRALTGLSEPQALIDHCLMRGAKVVALKMGARGAWVADAGARHRIEPFACRPVDATGAGDAFGGAFVARWLAGDPIERAGRYAAAAAALSTEGFGAIEPIPDRARVLRALGGG